VHGAGHMVPSTQPERASVLFTEFININMNMNKGEELNNEKGDKKLRRKFCNKLKDF